MSETISPLWSRRDGAEVLPPNGQDPRRLGTARHLATVIAAAAAAGPLAPNAYSRARLIRQMHASGLLTNDEARQTELVLKARPTDRTGGDADGSGASS